MEVDDMDAMTTPPEGAGMPGMVWVSGFGTYSGWSEEEHEGAVPYVPASRLAALEAERDAYRQVGVDVGLEASALRVENAALREKLCEAERELAIAGVRGSPPPWGDTTIGKLNTRIIALRAERDYLTLCLGEANASKDAAHGEVARAKDEAQRCRERMVSHCEYLKRKHDEVRAERDALVPLARLALFAISEAYARESNIVSRELLNEAELAGLYDPDDTDDVMDNMPRIIAARAVLARMQPQGDEKKP